MEIPERPAAVAVGSTNPTKVGACEVVFEKLGAGPVRGYPVDPGVPAQPIGMAETRRGAVRRAQNARELDGSRFGVGMEGGVDLAADGLGWLIGIAVIAVGPDRLLWAAGPRLLLPPAAVEAVRDGEELGPVIDRLSGLSEAKTGIGAIGWLTGGLVPRRDSWVAALAAAAAPLFHPDFYPGPV